MTFLNGTWLNPLPPVASKDPKTRYFHIQEGDQLDEALMTAWIKRASERSGERLF